MPEVEMLAVWDAGDAVTAQRVAVDEQLGGSCLNPTAEVGRLSAGTTWPESRRR